MAKGHMRSNREIRKPKKAAVDKSKGPMVSSTTALFAKSSKSETKPTKA